MFKKIVFSLATIFLLIIMTRCFPTYTVKQQNKNEIPNDSVIQVGSKIQTYNDDIYVFPRGFTVDGDSLKGFAQLFNLENNDGYYSNRSIPLKDIAMINNYEETTSGSRHFASFLFGLTGPLMTVTSLYCVSCPKCCFGSCPTIYTKGKNGYELECELFSECISKQLENDDVDVLIKKLSIDGNVDLMITNEALETHYINRFNLISVNHPFGTRLLPSLNDSLILVKSFMEPLSISNSKGINILSLTQKDDGNFYRSGTKDLDKTINDIPYDYIDVGSKVPSSSRNVKIIIKYRNTLLSTILLYDVVLASQGIEAVAWIDKMNNNPEYAQYFKMLYQNFSGIRIQSRLNNSWKNVGTLKDAGPLAWRYAGFEAPVDKNGNLKIRLKFFTDNMMIDYIAIDTSSSYKNDLEFTLPVAVKITNAKGEPTNEVYDFIKDDDDQYLVTNPGDNYTFKYKFNKKSNCEQTLVIFSRGYYYEWIRGDWVRNKETDYKFNLYDLHGTLNHLAESWLENKDIIEQEFFNQRIPLKR